MTYQPQNQNLTTGVISGCVYSSNGSTMFNISAGTIAIEDWSNPLQMRLKILSYSGVTGQLPPNPTTNIFTMLTLIESSTEGVAELQMTSEGLFTGESRRTAATLVSPIHPNGDGVIVAVTEDYQVAFGWTQTLNDMQHCRRACVEGNLITANGTNLSIDRASGTTALPFFNASVSTWISPSIRINAQQDVQAFIKQAQEPAGIFVGGNVTVVDPDNYDDSGVITALANNKWTIQRVFFFGQSDTMTISYGQNIYSSRAGAIAAVNLENFIEPANAEEGVWVASLILKKGTTDLSDEGDNAIIGK